MGNRESAPGADVPESGFSRKPASRVRYARDAAGEHHRIALVNPRGACDKCKRRRETVESWSFTSDDEIRSAEMTAKCRRCCETPDERTDRHVITMLVVAGGAVLARVIVDRFSKAK